MLDWQCLVLACTPALLVASIEDKVEHLGLRHLHGHNSTVLANIRENIQIAPGPPSSSQSTILFDHFFFVIRSFQQDAFSRVFWALFTITWLGQDNLRNPGKPGNQGNLNYHESKLS